MLGCRREDEAHLGEQASFLAGGRRYRSQIQRLSSQRIQPESTFSRASRALLA